jgi:Skp family chaperone for outer membrane proteins
VFGSLAFTLSVLNTQVALGSGSLQIGFHLPGVQPAAYRPGLDEEHVRAISAQEVSARLDGLKQDQQELVQSYSQMTREEMQQEMLRLARALEVAQTQLAHSFDTRLAYFGQEAARADREQRQAIDDINARVVLASNPR